MSIYRDVMKQQNTGEQRAPAAGPIAQSDNEMVRKLIPLMDNLIQAQGENRQAFGFAGLKGGEGASTLVFELTQMLSQRSVSSRTLVIDANAQATLTCMLGSAGNGGLQRIMTGAAGLSEAVIKDLLPKVDILTSKGGPSGEYDASSNLLQTEIFQARKEYDLILIDLPALAQPECVPLMRILDGSYLVFEADKTKHSAGKSAIGRLEGLGIRLEGILLNKRKLPIPSFLYSRF
jgi:Mrp family chromosome partitioning ATPase